ncbi:membrane integrity-associated transporter subunit PqiC [Herbaspirillum sp. alder98]|uniref:PqiC family protein n=1 Tax=Herbaspirillum sp. alder98 TaxID=2913096 RepID=UPI001CD8A0CA|nr:PqiC family protein [Herbaspirillum sp. alder98]MCA1324707.1 PqiC family protein [Herbaspirillum sp. alder98]
MPANKKISIISAALAAMALSACSSTPPTQFYTLATSPAAAVSTAGNATQPVFIEVLPVAVPERLARPQIVVRNDATRVDVLETERWSSPFNNELRDALANGVSRRLGAIDVSRSGRPADGVSYRIAVELRDLDAVRNGQVQAAFGWTITRSDDRKTAVCRLSVAEAVGGGAVADVVTAMQKVADRAAEVIAANVRGLQAGQGQCVP